MKRGFTLIELVAVISILLILTTIGLNKSSIVENYRAKQDINMIYKDIRSARNLAMSNKKMATVSFNKDNSYTISCGDYMERKRYSQKIKLMSKNIENIGFTKRGAATQNGSGTFIFLLLNREYKITVEPVTGKVNLKK
ncbi:prepilin-type N-terminal cleavage/methylation domain-containing protein [Anaerosphaera aminiphila DSM 21120]|uniref:Prepilin-type N-terminal cleavage/methylation domain-containing protein n=1 Tax=Anaerosphaera aminiphila DSM 21120 TaxID=1120995 RepID=A0A1M5P9S2_9FIRM|nr:type II secretion system protein [Anaerosphaera aminiphila]SHG98571.1 prepilin-type N-terminal cleavage/methylation domain-containing protein [Anaerosphaera aminiphila DSM 21120]